jgi:NitT/TauT family transport system ATP-binding protein
MSAPHELAAASHAAVDVAHLSYAYPSKEGSSTALDDVSLRLNERSFVTIVGRSGCGKSTLLKLIAGLLNPPPGSIQVEGEPVTGPVDDVRYVFQNYAQSLLPWLTVRQNVEFGQRYASHKRGSAVFGSVDDLLTAVGLAHVANRYPGQLSGGMQQRLAIARALASRPRLLLMDEPFSAVDAFNREQLQDLTLKIWAQSSLTVVVVTHDIEEAIYLGSRVVVLSPPGTGDVRELEIDLPYPRNQVTTREDTRYLAYRRQLHQLVMREQ